MEIKMRGNKRFTRYFMILLAVFIPLTMSGCDYMEYMDYQDCNFLTCTFKIPEDWEEEDTSPDASYNYYLIPSPEGKFYVSNIQTEGVPFDEYISSIFDGSDSEYYDNFKYVLIDEITVGNDIPAYVKEYTYDSGSGYIGHEKEVYFEKDGYIYCFSISADEINDEDFEELDQSFVKILHSIY